jgi:hypothetical protein
MSSAGVRPSSGAAMPARKKAPKNLKALTLLASSTNHDPASKDAGAPRHKELRLRPEAREWMATLVFTIPTGLRPPAQGCEERATLGCKTKRTEP